MGTNEATERVPAPYREKMLLFSKLHEMLSGYFDPKKIVVVRENK